MSLRGNLLSRTKIFGGTSLQSRGVPETACNVGHTVRNSLHLGRRLNDVEGLNASDCDTGAHWWLEFLIEAGLSRQLARIELNLDH